MSQSNFKYPQSDVEKIVHILTQGSSPKANPLIFKTIAAVVYYLTNIDKRAGVLIQKELSDLRKCDEVFTLLQKIELPYSIVDIARMLTHLSVAPELQEELMKPGTYPPVGTNETLETQYKKNLLPYIQSPHK